MALSIHDNLLISYEVQCEARTIVLRTEYRASDRRTEFTNVVFTGVQGYRFENDAFGNIIFDLETVPMERILTEYGAEISESYRMSGSPGPWAADLDSAGAYLREQGAQGFILSSSFGMSGWILAKEIAVLAAQPATISSSMCSTQS
jgi:hypothetical protein